jgi:uncharacterized protein (DUF885 family)
MPRYALLFALITALATRLSTNAQSAGGAGGNAELGRLADRYFDQVYFQFQPTFGTLAGFHQYDPQIETRTRSAIESQTAALHDFEKQVLAFSTDGLDGASRADHQLLLSNIQSTLLTLETIRPWETNPDVYSSGITSSAFTLIERKYAPADVRLRSLIAREKQMPSVLETARQNLRNCPRIYTEIAIQQIPGNISFFKSDVPAALTDAKDPALKAEFARTNAAVVSALESYGDWLRTTLLPQSKGDFRIGHETYSKKLLYDEMVDTPLDQLLQIGYDDLRKNQAAFNALAKQVDPAASPQATLVMLGSHHPAPDNLLTSFRDTFNGLIQFIGHKQIITIPSDVRPVLEETPPFMRAITQASMDTPGPFEKDSQTAYFNVTLPEKGWSRERTENYLHAFNIGTITSTAVHEAYPGHYVQLLWVNKTNLSKTRKLLGAATNIEGWAHYCEQMMIEEGFSEPGAGAKDANEARLIKLGQLQDALLRDARFVVGIKMHTGQMTTEQAVDFFEKEGYQSRAIGEVETKRGTSDPTYLYYTLGKLQILQLREDLKRKQGSAFSLKKFHDEFMQQGTPPIKIVREAMLGS